MKKNLNLLIAIIGLVAIFSSSCSVTKRYHNKGFHFEFASNKKAKSEPVKKSPAVVVEEAEEVSIVLETENQAEEAVSVQNETTQETKAVAATTKISKRKLVKQLKSELKNLDEEQIAEIKEISKNNAVRGPDNTLDATKTNSIFDNSMFKIGFFLFLAAILLYIIGVVLVFSLAGLAGIGIAFILFVLAYLCWLAGLVLMIVGLVQHLS
jgi:hypothetical protein